MSTYARIAIFVAFSATAGSDTPPRTAEWHCARFCGRETACRPIYGGASDGSLWTGEPLDACPVRCAAAFKFFDNAVLQRLIDCVERTDCRAEPNPEKACRPIAAGNRCTAGASSLYGAIWDTGSRCVAMSSRERTIAERIRNYGTFIGCAKARTILRVIACIHAAPCDERFDFVGICLDAAGFPG